MKCAVLVPTRDRPQLLRRALQTFASAASSACLDIVCVIVADDSEFPAVTFGSLQAVRAAIHPVRIDYLPPVQDAGIASGPGRTRTRALRYLAQCGLEHDSVIMFDDDISFSTCAYQSALVDSAGTELLSKIARQSFSSKTILGCDYLGRQDLSLLEHIALLSSNRPSFTVNASVTRDDVIHEAPNGVTGAFLFVPTAAANLPPFLPWYNEDYFWLRRMIRDGWQVCCVKHYLAHAPEDGLRGTFEALWFEQYGEALWRACQRAGADDLDQQLTILALDSLRATLEELSTVRLAILRSGIAEIQLQFSPIIMRTQSAFQDLLQCVEANVAHTFLDDLREVVKYCCD